MSSTLGVVYAAFGRPYLTMALASAATLRLTNPLIPFTIVTDITFDPNTIPWFSRNDRVTFSNVSQSANRTVKTSIYALSPYEKSLLLDADTLVLRSLNFIPFALDHFEVLARVVNAPPETPRTAHRILDSTWPMHQSAMCNGGVIAFRRSSGAEDFFAHWSHGFKALGLNLDQPSLLDALFSSSVRFFGLPERFNGGPRTRDVAVWHYTRRADRTARQLVERVGRSALNDNAEATRELARAMRPRNVRKRRSISYLRDRNADLLRRSPADHAVEALLERGWI